MAATARRSAGVGGHGPSEMTIAALPPYDPTGAKECRPGPLCTVSRRLLSRADRQVTDGRCATGPGDGTAAESAGGR